MTLESIRRRLWGQPLAILPTALAEMQAALLSPDIKARLAEFEASRADAKAAADEPQLKNEGGVAVIGLNGPIFPKADFWTWLFGGSGADAIGRQIRQAATDESVKAILLDIDSPGGSVYGIPELGDEVFAARRVKPVVAAADPMIASAAWWIASQASQVVSTSSGDVGSQGVFMIHSDLSKAFDDIGFKHTIIKSVPHKAEGNPYEPLSEEDAERFQQVVDGIQAEFDRAVSRGRGMALSTVRKEFGQGRLLTAKEALDRKMIDRIETAGQTLERLQNPAARAAIGRRAEIAPAEFEARMIEDFGMSNRQAKAVTASASQFLTADDACEAREAVAPAPDDVCEEREGMGSSADDVCEERDADRALVSAFCSDLRSRLTG